MMKENIVIVFITLMLIGCAKKQNVSVDVISVNIEQRDKISIFDIFDKVDIIPLQTTDSSLIVNIDKLIAHENRYYLFDYRIQKVMVFDDSGKFLFNIGQKGGGPEEYINVSDFDIYENHVSLVLPIIGMLANFDLNGNFIDKWRLPTIVGAYTSLKYINSDTIAFWTYDNENRLKLYSKPENLFFKEAMPEEAIIFNSFNTSVFPYQNYIIRPTDNQVYEITSQGDFTKAYKWDFGNLNNEMDKIKVPELTSLDNQIDYVRRIHASEVINYIFSEGGGNSEYIYAQLSRKNKQVNIFHKKEDGKNYVFEETIEKAKFYPMYWAEDYVIGICPTSIDITYDDIIPDIILDEENLKKKIAWDELDNPLLVKYHFKK